MFSLVQQLFEFADKYRGKYDSSITVAQKFYQSISGYAVSFWALDHTTTNTKPKACSVFLQVKYMLDWLQDELLWAAAWLYQATNDHYYLDYLGRNGDALGGTGWSMTEFGWDVKYAGAQVLAAKVKFSPSERVVSVSVTNGPNFGLTFWARAFFRTPAVPTPREGS